MMKNSLSRLCNSLQSTAHRTLLAGMCLPALLAQSIIASEPGDGLRAANAAQSLGLTADALACVDVHGSEPGVMLGRLIEEYSTYEQLLSLRSQIVEHQKIIHNARSILRDVADDQNALTSLSDAEAQITLLSNQALSTRNALITTVLDELADSAMVADVLHTTGLFLSLPPEYRLAVETVDEVKRLNWALRMEDRAQGSGGDINDNAEQKLLQARAQADVQTAMARLDTYADANALAIEQWVTSN